MSSDPDFLDGASYLPKMVAQAAVESDSSHRTASRPGWQHSAPLPDNASKPPGPRLAQRASSALPKIAASKAPGSTTRRPPANGVVNAHLPKGDTARSRCRAIRDNKLAQVVVVTPDLTHREPTTATPAPWGLPAS